MTQPTEMIETSVRSLLTDFRRSPSPAPIQTPHEIECGTVLAFPLAVVLATTLRRSERKLHSRTRYECSTPGEHSVLAFTQENCPCPCNPSQQDWANTNCDNPVSWRQGTDAQTDGVSQARASGFDSAAHAQFPIGSNRRSLSAVWGTAEWRHQSGDPSVARGTARRLCRRAYRSPRRSRWTPGRLAGKRICCRNGSVGLRLPAFVF